MFNNNSKLVCKGNVAEKLASKGIEAGDLYPYLAQLDVDVSAEAEAVADAILASLSVENEDGKSIAGVFNDNDINGAGYLSHLHASIVATICESANGLSVQRDAFKASLVANTEGLELSDFVADAKAKAKVAPKNNAFASFG